MPSTVNWNQRSVESSCCAALEPGRRSEEPHSREIKCLELGGMFKKELGENKRIWWEDFETFHFPLLRTCAHG